MRYQVHQSWCRAILILPETCCYHKRKNRALLSSPLLSYPMLSYPVQPYPDLLCDNKPCSALPCYATSCHVVPWRCAVKEANHEHRVDKLRSHHSNIQRTGRGSTHCRDRDRGAAFATRCLKLFHTMFTLRSFKQNKYNVKSFKPKFSHISTQ